jgi:hypothetical protein
MDKLKLKDLVVGQSFVLRSLPSTFYTKLPFEVVAADKKNGEGPFNCITCDGRRFDSWNEEAEVITV